MIKLSLKMQEVLQQPTISWIFLVDAFGNKMTSYPRDLNFLGENYRSDGSLVSVDMPRQTSIVDRQAFEIVFSDNFYDFATVAGSNLVGQLVSVWLSFEDPETGLPVLNPEDVILIYRGRVSAPSNKLIIDEGHVFTLECTSPMADLDRVRTQYASQDYNDTHYPGDTSYVQLFRDSGPVALRWGKK